VRLAAERDDWMDLLQSEGLADKLKRKAQKAQDEPLADGHGDNRQQQPAATAAVVTQSPYTQATTARSDEAHGTPSRSPAASPPRCQHKSHADSDSDSRRMPSPPTSPAGPPPSPPIDGGRRGRPNRRMAARSTQVAERDDTGLNARGWRDITHDHSPSFGSADGQCDGESEDDRRLERARKRGRTAWEQARIVERQRESIRKLKTSLEAESQLRAKAENVSDEAVVELEKLRVALADERSTRERAEELLAVAADAGHKAVSEVAQCNESISDAEKREQHLQGEVDKLREWQAAAAEGTNAAAEKLLELQQVLFSQEAELRQTKLEVETVRKQWGEEVHESRTQLERAQQQLDSAKGALSQSKREGEIKDQVSVSQAAELHEVKLEVETVTQQWRDEVHKLTSQLEHTQQQLDSAKGALSQSKREGEIKDQVSVLQNCAAYPLFYIYAGWQFPPG
jgi:hypothetical protein